MRSAGDRDFPEAASFHQLPWSEFDELARGEVSPEAVRRLRYAERSRRLLLLRKLLDEVTKTPELFGPLPSPEDAWDLLARVETRAPRAFDLMLAHPYVGSWAGYTIRLLRKRITGVCPLWMHIGHLHAIAAAAAIHARLNFRISVPVWKGGAILPTLGSARLPVDEPHSVAGVRGDRDGVEISNGHGRVALTDLLDADTSNWWAVRSVTVTAARQQFTTKLEDLDPYRGLHEPVLPQRLEVTEVAAWRNTLADAWQLVVQHVPKLADALSVGLDSIVPVPVLPFRNASASTGEAFGSALIARPDNGASLAATLVHEFQHIILGGVLHMARLYEDDSRERLYVPWRPDPRPLSGALTGSYAFFGVAAFWRQLARTQTGELARRAMFEFAQARSQTWRVLEKLRDDQTLTIAGRRFVNGVTSRLEPWQDEPVPAELRRLADSVAADHRASWRMRHLRPSTQAVAELTEAWFSGQPRPPTTLLPIDPEPTPIQDGSPSHARADLIRLGVVTGDPHVVNSMWRSVPDATIADLAYVTGRFADAAQGYRAELMKDPDRVASWIGLGLALTALGASPAARALIQCPELVRAVRRRISTRSPDVPTPERLAAWIGQAVS